MKNWISFWAALLFLTLEEQQTYAQNKAVFDLTTNPYSWANSVGSAQMQVQALDHFAVCAGGSFSVAETRLQDFDQRQNTILARLEVRWFPFGTTVFGKKKAPKVQRICGGKFGCLDPSKTVLSNFVRGVYIAPGYQFERIDLELIPLPHLESPIPEFQYEIKSHALTFNIGYQVRLGHITLGAGYGWAFDQPCWSGPYDIFGDRLFTQTYPWKMRVSSAPRFEVGINF